MTSEPADALGEPAWTSMVQNEALLASGSFEREIERCWRYWTSLSEARARAAGASVTATAISGWGGQSGGVS